MHHQKCFCLFPPELLTVFCNYLYQLHEDDFGRALPPNTYDTISSMYCWLVSHQFDLLHETIAAWIKMNKTRRPFPLLRLQTQDELHFSFSYLSTLSVLTFATYVFYIPFLSSHFISLSNLNVPIIFMHIHINGLCLQLHFVPLFMLLSSLATCLFFSIFCHSDLFMIILYLAWFRLLIANHRI